MKKEKNKMKINDRKIQLFIIIGLVVLIVAPSVFAYVMSSPNYRIQSDSINVGGVRQTSPNYFSEDTIGEPIIGISSSTLYQLQAGYQYMVTAGSYVSLSLSTTSIQLLPNIGGVSGGSASGTYIATAITNNSTGYSLYVNASTSPALQMSSYYFSDYTPTATSTPDYTWSVPATTSEFGFTPEGTDIIQTFKDNNSSCATGTNDTVDKCWYNFSSSTQSISLRYSANFPSGTQTIVKLKAESGTSNVQQSGTYQGYIITTLVSN